MSAQDYKTHPAAQLQSADRVTGIIWKRWEGEARRLFIEFWRTADERHLRAFAAHVKAMRSYCGGPR